MLVCNVSLRPPRRAIAADLAETATADDASTTGQVVFATLVDDPASVNDIVDAYLGEIMVEAASATDTVDWLNPPVEGDIAESTTAAETHDAVVGLTAVTWDSGTVTAVTLSSSDRVATNTGTTSTDQGAHVATTSGKTSGKYYFEITNTTTMGVGGDNKGVGVGTTASTYTNMGNSATTGVMVYTSSGNMWANGSLAVSVASTIIAGSVICLAVDLDNRKMWIAPTSAANWNNSGTANPATNTGGITIPSGTMIPFCVFGGGSGSSGNVFTANFGATTFARSVPSGFTAGWPV